MTGGWRGLIGLVCCVLAMDTAASADASADRFPLPPRQWGPPVHDTPTLPYLLIDRLELRATGGPDARMWDVQGWVGSDYNKVWFKSEGESEVGGRTEQGDAQLLYARLISPFWYVQAGVRRHWRPTPARNSLVIGAQGLAPGWFEVGASAFVEEGGRLSARFEAEYDLLLTQRWILQPRIESNVSAQADAARGLGSGVNDVELGVRLRYELRRELAPYIGVNWTRKVGATADLARGAQEDVSERSVVIGIRAWF
ncbi:MAG: copper resistance protein B [Burkholderiaceae bacterium]|nr:copper resistance protein B [Burkholderiaceae bacterium]